MANRDAWQAFQRTMQSYQRGGGRGPGGPGGPGGLGGFPKRLFGSAAGGALLIGGGILLSNSLFNGTILGFWIAAACTGEGCC